MFSFFSGFFENVDIYVNPLYLERWKLNWDMYKEETVSYAFVQKSFMFLLTVQFNDEAGGDNMFWISIIDILMYLWLII